MVVSGKGYRPEKSSGLKVLQAVRSWLVLLSRHREALIDSNAQLFWQVFFLEHDGESMPADH